MIFDYEAIKKSYFDHGAANSVGHGRFESAFFHTVKKVFEAGAHESAVRIAELEATIVTLNQALRTTSEGNAQLLAENAQLREHLAAMRDVLSDEARA